MLAMFSNTAVAGGDVAAAVRVVSGAVGLEGGGGGAEKEQWNELDVTYCLRVFVNRVGIVATADCRCLNSRFAVMVYSWWCWRS